MTFEEKAAAYRDVAMELLQAFKILEKIEHTNRDYRAADGTADLIAQAQQRIDAIAARETQE